MLRQNDLAVIEWSDTQLTKKAKGAGLIIRGKPTPSPGDSYYTASLLRDNDRKELTPIVKPLDILGFSPKHGLLQSCEPETPSAQSYTSDRASALVIRRHNETVLLGIGSFGSPKPQTIDGRRCVVTTYIHLHHHLGWMKIALDNLKRQPQRLNPQGL
jgi:hypothetical protein